MNQRAVTASVWLLSGSSLLMVSATVVFAVLSTIHQQDLVDLLFFSSCVLVGSLVALHRPRNVVGWYMLGGGFGFLLMTFSGHYALYGLITRPGSLPGANVMAWPQTWLWIPGSASLFLLLPLYFPSGRLPSPRWSWLTRFIIVAAALTAVLAAINPGNNMIQVRSDQGTIVNPLGVRAAESATLVSISSLVNVTIPVSEFVLLGAVAVSLVVRFTRSTGVERQQLKWLTFSIAGLPVAIFLEQIVHPHVSFAALWLVTIPIGVGIAILKHNLYDIDLIINRTLVYGALSASV
ncbi:MAG TPA: hypothetical protein VHV31_16495, partial [Nitrolancea sp.]|nr:hypothetical protein [Nitrolancea sp.]